MSKFAETVFYAIGDVHGMSLRLKDLHRKIHEFHRDVHAGQPYCVVHLGDYIDRGSDSCGVIETIIELEQEAARTYAFDVISIMGNHELMLLNALERDQNAFDLWYRNGGAATLSSYDRIERDNEGFVLGFPYKHRKWLERLPSIWKDDDRKLVFVHAGVDVLSFPESSPDHHLWTRSARFLDVENWHDNPAMNGWTIVHGHTPTLDRTPDIAGDTQRINVDTGACFGGPLSAAVLAPNEKPRFLEAC